MNTILYGVAYYPEYMPTDRLEADVSLMQAAGLSLVRVGESTWTNWEPRDGDFQFSWMQRILDRLHAADIKVILGIPTYSIPPWLHRAHPDIVVTHLGVSAPRLQEPAAPTYPSHRAPGAYGPRQNQDYTHPVFRRYAERITAAIVQRFRDHPAVIGYQIDNETAPNHVATQYSQPLFLEHLKKKYGTPAALNRHWGLAFWGQLLDTWDELPARDGVLNPGYLLEWDRFQQEIVREYLASLAAVVRVHSRDQQFITHDFVGGPLANVDLWAIARELDYVAVNVYYPPQNKMSGLAIWLAGDLARSLKQRPHFVMETNAQTLGWDSRTQYPQYPGQLRLAAYAHIAAGATLVEYWHWASAHNGQETFWKGVLGHDLQPNRTYAEVAQVGGELRALGPSLGTQRKQNQVAILLSADSINALRQMPFSDNLDYSQLLKQIYEALYTLNVETDFVSDHDTDFSSYAVLLVPPLYTASNALLQAIADFVAKGGHVLMLFKSGFTDEHATVRAELAPGPLRQAVGCYYQEFSNLAEPVPLIPDVFGLESQNTASVWAEWLVPETAEVIARLDHPIWPYPVITRNQHGRGSLTYQATVVTPAYQRALIADLLARAGLTGVDQSLQPSVRVRHATDTNGRKLHYYFNFSSVAESFSYPYREGIDQHTERIYSANDEITLRPWDLCLIREADPDPAFMVSPAQRK